MTQPWRLGPGGVLVLGGTTEGRALAGMLDEAGLPAVSSLAGVTAAESLPGRVRVGGFGGVEGLIAFLRTERIDAVVDATHPFAATMTEHVARACAATDVPLLRLQRPSWRSHPDAAAWHWTPDAPTACSTAAALATRPLLAVGRGMLPAFFALPDAVARIITPLPDTPPRWTVLVDRGPFTLASELDLLDRERVDAVVTKDSGGPTDAKLDAARLAGVPVVVVERPPLPRGPVVVSDAASALAWCERRTGRATDAQRRRSR